MLDRQSEALTECIPASVASADAARLRFVDTNAPGIRRVRTRHGFGYRLASGERVRDAPTLDRIRALAIPPAWTEVWICPAAQGHIQATGRDAKGRKQYRYHADWHRVRDEAKYERLLEFAKSLPRLRNAIRAHMSERGLGRQKVLATVVHLLETTLIRVGNQEYARANKSFGLTTLRDRHVLIDGGEIRFRFRGKTGREWNLKLSDRRIARIVRSCQDLPGQHLFQYEDGDGSVRQVSSADVNDYLREIAGTEVTAKDFRTWAGTVLAAMALREFDSVDSQSAARGNIRLAVEAVAARLGNTATICRKCYIHPEVVSAYLEGSLAETLAQKIARELRRELRGMPPEEAATLVLLHLRLVGRRRPGGGRARKRSTLRRRTRERPLATIPANKRS